jgi:stage II sporulation protein D (peptidoglycan lytic transglycosylase)
MICREVGMHLVLLGAMLLLTSRSYADSVLSELKIASDETMLQAEKPGQQQKKFFVRVLLADAKIDEEISWVLQSPDGFSVCNAHDDREHMKARLSTLTLSATTNGLYLNGKKVRGNMLTFKPRAANCVFKDGVYEGTILFLIEDHHVYLINVINLEDYVYSVLRWEGWPGWPLEVNKAFAIMCRSYVVAKVLEVRSKEKKAPYDIRNTNIHQTYKGTHSATNIREAVEETKGIILSYQKKPIVAMYDSCCGSSKPSKRKDINFGEARYLERAYACTFCRDCKIYNWRTAYSLDEFHQRLQQEFPLQGPIKAIKIADKDGAGVVHELHICSPSSKISLTGKQLYRIFKEIKSLCLSVEVGSKEVIFTGRGYGHLIGLCQWGARQMVKEGWPHKRVLAYYYPGTQFMKVEVK